MIETIPQTSYLNSAILTLFIALPITFNALTVRQQVALDTHISNLGAFKMNETIPQTGFVRIPQILSVIPVSRSSWWAGVKSGRYPAPIKLGANTTVWKVEDITALIKQIAEKGGV